MISLSFAIKKFRLPPSEQISSANPSSIFFQGDMSMMIYPLTIGGAYILTSILAELSFNGVINE
jgi:hypothetical protein